MTTAKSPLRTIEPRPVPSDTPHDRPPKREPTLSDRMRRHPARHRLRRGRGEDGAALVEFALVFALFVLVLYGLIAFGMMLALKQSITHAAADGARAAVGAYPDPAIAGDTLQAAEVRAATAKVTGALGWLGSKYDPSFTTATVAPCSGTGTAQCITVKISYPYSSPVLGKGGPLVAPAPGLGLVMPDAIGTTAVVQVSG